MNQTLKILFLGSIGFIFNVQALITTKVTAKSALLINAKTGAILFEKNKDLKRSPASLTKLATCLFALDKVSNLEQKITCSPQCLIKMSKKKKIENNYDIEPYLLEPDGMSYGIFNNEVLTIKDLLYGMMLPSANDAANVVAYALSKGNIMNFMKEMNEYLVSIGCQNTTFYNPHGLYYPQHLTTASDLALIAREALKDPRLLDICKSISYQRPKTNKQPSRTVWNLNKALRKGPYYYDKIKGLKTGSHENAGYCYIAFAEDNHRSLICVVMGCQDSDTAFMETKKLLELAFGEKLVQRKLFNAKESIFTKKIAKADNLLKAQLKEDVFLSFYPSEEIPVKPQLVWEDKALPIYEGLNVGSLFIVSEDEKHFFQALPLYAKETVTQVHFSGGKYYIFFVIFLIFLLLLYKFIRRTRENSALQD